MSTVLKPQAFFLGVISDRLRNLDGKYYPINEIREMSLDDVFARLGIEAKAADIKHIDDLERALFNTPPSPKVTVPLLTAFQGNTLGWVGDTLYAQREIDAGRHTPVPVHVITPNADLIRRLASIHGQTIEIENSAEVAEWAELLG